MSTHHGILIHVVFSTKLRRPLLADDWRNELLAYLGGTAKEHKAVILKSGGIEDHVHLLMKTHPAFAISDTIKLVKGNASRWINQQRKNRRQIRMAAWLRRVFREPINGRRGQAIHREPT